MAAPLSLGRQVRLLSLARNVFFPSSRASESLTYCQKVFFSRNFKEYPVEENLHEVTPASKCDKEVSDYLEESCVGPSGVHINYKKHPGIMRKKRAKLPTRLHKSINVLLKKYPVESMAEKTQKLVRHLWGRHPPISKNDFFLKKKEIESQILEKDGEKLSQLEGEELEVRMEKLNKKVLKRLNKVVYPWQPMQYDALLSYTYLIGRVDYEYGVHFQCFGEIAYRDPEFKPLSIFNYGSKVGTGIWAANEYWKEVGEHYCVDPSTHMNTIARLLLQNGNDQSHAMCITGVSFRNFLPSPKQNKFSMVVCPHMLIEQASEKERIQLVLDLWEMTEDYLVLIENGTGMGFKLIDEAREFLIHLSKDIQDDDPLKGHVFAPCPHQNECPKKRDKKQPCLTECSGTNNHFSDPKHPEEKTNHRYSYVIFKKGPRKSDWAWPRVLQVSKGKQHYNVWTCAPCSKLQFAVVSKSKFDKHVYGCCKHIQQGDRLPVTLSPEAPGENKESAGPQDEETLSDPPATANLTHLVTEETISAASTDSEEAIPVVSTDTEEAIPVVDNYTEEAIPVVSTDTEESIPVVDNYTEETIPLVNTYTEETIPVVSTDTDKANPVVDTYTKEAIPVVSTDREKTISAVSTDN